MFPKSGSLLTVWDTESGDCCISISEGILSIVPDTPSADTTISVLTTASGFFGAITILRGGVSSLATHNTYFIIVAVVTVADI
jgi:hypothetical protein